MKTKCSIALFIHIFLLIAGTRAQLLSTAPVFPRDTSALTITVDCSKGNKGLYDYASTGDVYVHLGLITSASANSSDWKYVKFTWGTTDPSAHAVYAGNNEYQYAINNIRSFFGVPAGETIKKIAILFRNGNGSLVQRNSDGSDMFIPVYGDALATQFLLPLFQPLYTPVPEPINKKVGDTVTVRFVASKKATLSIYFNDTLRQTASNADSLGTDLLVTAAGNQRIIAKADNGAESGADTIDFYSASPSNIAPLPAGVQDGINYLPGDTSVVLVLFAPGKTRASVIGDFNSWTQSPVYEMSQTPDGKYFWVQINGLTPGAEYAYQFIIDNNLKIADYYAEKILDPDNDQYIPASVYPNLKSYPAGKTTGIVSVLQTRPPAYNWGNTHFTRPDKHTLAIYELLVRDFVAAHNYQGIIDTLGYLKNLGINAIELMPVTEFEGNLSWGYNPSFYFAPDKYYGPKNELKRLIDSCHSRGIAVIMDIVLNHSYGQSPMVQLYFNSAASQPAADNPWFNQTAPHQSISFGYDFNHESAATQYFVNRVLQFWLDEYRIDGFRFDFAKGFTQKQTNSDATLSAYDTGRINILSRYTDDIQSASPGAYVILEYFVALQEEQTLAAKGAMSWGNMNYNFNQATMGYSDGWDLSGTIYSAQGFSKPDLLAYMESHDEERLMFKNIAYGNQSGSYIIKGDTTVSLKRNEMAAAFYLAIPGPKMIWQFGELGYDYSINTCGDGSINSNCRTDAKPIRWDYLQDPRRKQLHDVYARLLKLRSDHPGLDTASGIHYSLDGTFKTLQVTTPDLGIAVMGNFGVSSTSGSISFPHSGTWYEYFTGDSVTATGSSQSFSLDPGEYRFYIDKNLADTAKQSDSTIYPINPSTIKIFPNPVVNSTAVIVYELPSAGHADLSIFNSMGQRMASVNLGDQPAGKHVLPVGQLPVNLFSLANGVYVMNVTCNRDKLHTVFVMQH